VVALVRNTDRNHLHHDDSIILVVVNIIIAPAHRKSWSGRGGGGGGGGGGGEQARGRKASQKAESYERKKTRAKQCRRVIKDRFDCLLRTLQDPELRRWEASSSSSS
jgi:hypothetical protein